MRSKEELIDSVKLHGRLTQFNEELEKFINGRPLSQMSQSEIEEMYEESYRRVMNT